MKACPTCGREIAETVSVCDTCDAWAAGLSEPRPDDTQPLKTTDVPKVAETAPVAAANAAPAGRPAASRRQLTYIAAGVGAIALTGFAISVSGGSPSDAPVAATPAAPVATVKTAASAAPAPTAAAATAVQAWNSDNRATWLGPRVRGAAFELLSEKAVKTWSGSARPSLVVRCTPQSLEAFVVTGSPLKIEPKIEGKRVTTSVDGEPLRTEQWVDADDRTAVFAPDPAAFVQRLRNARSLEFGYSPHNSTDVVAQFNVAGIDALMGAATSKECRASARR